MYTKLQINWLIQKIRLQSDKETKLNRHVKNLTL